MQIPNRPLSIYGTKPFKVFGQEVFAYSPIIGEIVLDVPWPVSHYPDERETQEISDRARAIIAYCQLEGVFSTTGIHINVLLQHKSIE